jgi:hypothetical protein
MVDFPLELATGKETGWGEPSCQSHMRNFRRSNLPWEQALSLAKLQEEPGDDAGHSDAARDKAEDFRPALEALGGSWRTFDPEIPRLLGLGAGAMIMAQVTGKPAL